MIYFVQETISGYIKIGFTDSPDAESRVRSLQTANPGRLVPLLLIPGDMEEEKELHRIFAEANVCGEWFRPTPNLLQYLLACASKVSSPALPGEDNNEDRGAVPDESLVRPDHLFRYYGNGGHTCILTCPICGFDYTHPLEAWTRLGHDCYEAGIYEGTVLCGVASYRRSALVTVYLCEGQHYFALVVQQHKGQNFATVEELPDYSDAWVASQKAEATTRWAKLTAERAEDQARQEAAKREANGEATP